MSSTGMETKDQDKQNDSAEGPLPTAQSSAVEPTLRSMTREMQQASITSAANAAEETIVGSSSETSQVGVAHCCTTTKNRGLAKNSHAKSNNN